MSHTEVLNYFRTMSLTIIDNKVIAASASLHNFYVLIFFNKIVDISFILQLNFRANL